MKKVLKFILIVVLIYVAVLVIEFFCLYAVKGDNIRNYLKDVWEWYVLRSYNYVLIGRKQITARHKFN